MTIKRILVPLPGFIDHANEIEMALSAAKLLEAHVEVLYISQPPPRETVGGSELVFGQRSAVFARLSAYDQERDRVAREAYGLFAQACALHGIPTLTPNDEPGRPLAAAWRQVEGSFEEVGLQRAAEFDLIVAASATVLESLKLIAEQSLLRARRPVLLTPLRRQTQLMDDALIAWDESPECWHAVSSAIPFLRIAKSVLVVSVDRDPRRRRNSQAEVVAYLHSHGISATARVVAPDRRSVGDTLLAIADDLDIGLLVMGAYSHSRLREILLGGATRHVLRKASARPVLLAH